MTENKFVGSKILLVEDEETLAVGLEYNLNEEGYQIVWAQDGKQALDFFNTKKTTIGKKATQIEKDCKLRMGAEGFCSKKITDMFVFYKTHEGFIVPKRRMSRFLEPEVVFKVVNGEEAGEIERLAGEQRSIREIKREDNELV